MTASVNAQYQLNLIRGIGTIDYTLKLRFAHTGKSFSRRNVMLVSYSTSFQMLPTKLQLQV